MKKTALILICCIAAMFCFNACSGISGNESGKTDGVKQEGNSNGTFLPGETAVPGGETLPGQDNDSAQNADDIPGITFEDFGYIEFGYYPQTLAEKDAVEQMSKTTDKTGYYVSSYDNEHYARIAVADVYSLYEDEYEFSDESIIKDRETYYFKVEPIKWRVFAQLGLTGDFKTIYLVSEVILDSTAFLGETEYLEDPTDGNFYNVENGVLANNWAYSALREWMNGEFYDKAFAELTDEQEAMIIERDVSEVCDVYDENNSKEKVFALSYEQAEKLVMLNAIVSDYARCRGTWMSVYPEFYGNGRWWLSTPGDKSYRACYVSDHTSVSASGESLGSTFMGVRPAIMMTVDDAFEILQDEEEEE